MNSLGSKLWRLFFIVAALLILIGGPRHPRGTMEEMLAHPDWVPAHSLMLAGLIALLVGLINYQRNVPLPQRTHRWLRIAMVGTVLQAIEMAVHTAAAIDHANLVAGSATPVLTTHLWLSAIFYPLFAVSLMGLIVAGMRDHVLGSPWIGWLGILGLVAHGAAAPLSVVLELAWAPKLFPLLILFAAWLLLTGFWPLRESANGSMAEATR